ncbi:hypothetical protein QNI16_17160 [Cytophagaceae bacterium YF14B1]|uniref:Uncharacterized protein n=1 Tax=Xanthocytophaga flava TaxID=3048013 RepID=A0AAE3U825_9BACT|nr:hypothetical protein [Xanthocytophaga flavus]MDJ1482237.1 hypothetical protein [Xanthocytophaga flavus]
MPTEIINYYDGFEGEPEIILTQKDELTTKQIRLWDGYFNAIMNLIKVDPISGRWTHLAYYYHLHIGWYEEDSWQIQDLASTLKQIQEIQIPKTNDMDILVEIQYRLIHFLEDAISNNRTVCIHYK